jgi:hypothetical protein
MTTQPCFAWLLTIEIMPTEMQDAAEPGREDGDRRGEAQQPGGGAQAAREARLRVDAAAAIDHACIELVP